MKFAMCNEFCEGWSLADACRLAAEAGYDGIEIAPFTIAESVEEAPPARRAEVRRTAADAGLEVVGLHWLLASPKGLHMNGPDPAVRARTVRYLGALVDFCADIGGRTLIFGSPKQRDVLPGQTYEEVWQSTVQAFRSVAPRAVERGVVLCIEALGPGETNFINTAAEARRLVEAVDHPGFRMMLDVKAMTDDEEPMPDIIRNSIRYVEHVHANDGSTLPPGFGETDLAPVATALREVGYDGYVSVEPLDFSPGPEAIARESLRYLKGIFR